MPDASTLPADDGRVLHGLHGGVATITLDHPARHNALTPALAGQLLAALLKAAADSATRVVLLRANGPRFGVGGDVRWLAADPHPANAARQVLRPLHAALRTVREIDVPVVCAVQGVAAGGSLALALACDVGLWDADARLVPAYAALGASPDCGLTMSLTHALGPQRALEWLLDGSTLTAVQARELGLLRHVVPTDDLDAQALAMATRLAGLPPRAVMKTKRLVRRAVLAGWSEQLADELESFVQCAQTPEFQQRVAALVGPARAAASTAAGPAGRGPGVPPGQARRSVEVQP